MMKIAIITIIVNWKMMILNCESAGCHGLVDNDNDDDDDDNDDNYYDDDDDNCNDDDNDDDDDDDIQTRCQRCCQ